MLTASFRFGTFELQPHERRLLRDGNAVVLGARAFDVLLALAARPGQLCTKAELLAEVWPGTVVEEANLSVQISALRKVLGDGLIVTIAGRGYRFTGTPVPETAERAITPHVRPANLPAATTAFVGRFDEISAIRDIFRRGEARICTITGVGGTGKSRLAVEVARGLVDDYPDGVLFVPLAAIAQPEMVLPAIAHAFGVHESAGEDLGDTLGQALREKHMLLLLDNFEQVVEAASLVSTLLAAAPHLHVLVTSREILRISGERDYSVEPLAVPNLGSLPPIEALAAVESVALFMARARAVRPGLLLTQSNAHEVARICCRLEGLPLALELAAARARVLSLARMLEELDDRLGFLTGGPRNEPVRRRTLRATIDWSYQFLNPREEAMFRKLAVFVDGATLEAIERVCASDEGTETVATLESLVAKSLVRRMDTADAPRFSMLETIRDYARECLAASVDAEEIAAARTEYFAELAEAVAVRMNSPEQGILLRRLDAEAENLRAALAHAVAVQDVAVGLRLCKALHQFWATRGLLSEGRRWCARMLDVPTDEPASANRIATTHTMAVLAMAQNDYGVARPLLVQCADHWREMGDLRRVSRALNNLGIVLENLGELAGARRAYQESLAIKEEIGDRSFLSTTLGNLANVVAEEGDLTGARALLEQAVANERELGGQHNLAIGLCNLSGVMRRAGDVPAARRAGEEGVAILRQLNARGTLATVLEEMGNLARDEGEIDAARGAYVESLTIASEIGDRRATAAALEGLAILAVAMRQAEQAAHSFSAASRIRDEIKVPLPESDRARIESAIAQARAFGDDAAFKQAWASGLESTLEFAVEYALHASRND